MYRFFLLFHSCRTWAPLNFISCYGAYEINALLLVPVVVSLFTHFTCLYSADRPFCVYKTRILVRAVVDARGVVLSCSVALTLLYCYKQCFEQMLMIIMLILILSIHQCHRTAWLLILLSSMAAFFYTSADCVLNYMSQRQPRDGNHGDQPDNVSALPAFTICNLNPLRSVALKLCGK